MSHSEISTAAPTATIISQQQFGSYAQAWVQAASTGNHLAEAFQKVGYERLTYASFDFQTVVWLVSTVGARRIKAQFVLVPDSKTANGKHTPAHFSVVLYAVDALDGRISAYYLGNNSFTPKTEQLDINTEEEVTKAADPNLGAPVAFDLVKIWLTNWSSPNQHITRDLFTSKYGALQGYTFELGDFMDPLFYSQKFGSTQVLRVGFALHEYYAAFANNVGTESTGQALTRTFGLVLRFYGTTPAEGTVQVSRAAVSAGEPGQPFYDLSTPYPPGY